ncbi:MAG: rhomboid family intramembrane serine protease [Dehalococcoidia bacterium]|nr:rhomboid family intramembrane serine protease [Dehalococcoidia bacterium]
MIPVGDSVRSRTIPYVNLAIIALNLLVFVYELTLGSELNRNRFLCDWGIIPGDVTNFFAPPSRPELLLGPCGLSSSQVGAGVLLRPFTAMFMHAGWFHILGNMLFLWIFGDNVEDALGHLRYLLFYLICGLGAAAAQILMTPHDLLPAVGASGAIAGVMGAYLVLYPRANIAVVIPLLILLGAFYIPAVLLIGMWFLVQLFSGVASIGYATGGSGGVAWWAHIGGFLVGMLLIALFRPRRRSPYGPLR